MITYINGNIAYKSPTQITVDVGGIGYELHISLYTYELLKDTNNCKIFTYLHITQDAYTLYGFVNMEEKQTFLQLIGVNGIGPRVAMTILSSMKPEELQQAIMTHNAVALQAIKGIGQKVAQRIILELHGKIIKLDGIIPNQQVNQLAIYEQALAALAKLGMHKSIAEKTVAAILKNSQGDITVEEVIKLALKS
jgi:Holliday junction DNA helicase RuvA